MMAGRGIKKTFFPSYSVTITGNTSPSEKHLPMHVECHQQLHFFGRHPPRWSQQSSASMLRCCSEFTACLFLGQK